MGDTIKEIDYKKEYFNCLTHINLLKEQLASLESNHEILIDTFQAERENLCKEIKKHSEARQRAIEKIKELEQQLAEKEAERNKLANTLNQLIFSDHAEDYIKQLRHQICEEIRKIFDTDINYTFDIETLYDVLDEIEIGDE